MSFFNDDDGPEPPSSADKTEGMRRPRPRRPRPEGGRRSARGWRAQEHRAVMMRRRMAVALAVVAVIVIVIVISAIVGSQKSSAVETYGHEVSKIGRESERDIAKGLFTELTGASQKVQLDVTEQLNQLHSQAELIASQARRLSVPGGVVETQRSVLLALGLRTEGISKVAGAMRRALGGKAKEVSPQLAGAMEIFLASDVVWSQRVAPLLREELSSAKVAAPGTLSSRFLPNLGWLDPETVLARISGQGTTEAGQLAPGTHGSALTGVSVSGAALQAEPVGTEAEPPVNHLATGANPTFTVTFQNTGENPETDVKVHVSVMSGGKRLTASHSVNETEPGQTLSVDIPVNGVVLGAASQVEVKVEAVPGETNLENNKATYLAVFE